MSLTTLVAPLQEAVTEKLFSGSLESGSVEAAPEAFADKLVRAAAHRAEIISQRREAARRYTAVRAASARQRRDAVLQKRDEDVLRKVELKGTGRGSCGSRPCSGCAGRYYSRSSSKLSARRRRDQLG